MLKSIPRCAIRLTRCFLSKEVRITNCSRRTKPDVPACSLMTSVVRYDNDKKRRADKGKGEVSQEVKEAAVQAAKSLPGDWTKTAEELLARLQVSSSQSTDSSVKHGQENGETKSLLSSMKVGRSFVPGKDRKGGRQASRQRPDDREIYPHNEVSSTQRMHRQDGEDGATSHRSRRGGAPQFKDLFGVPRLGIFDAKQVTKTGPGVEKDDLWAQAERERIRQIQGGLPNNAFEEMIRLTEEGKVWNFPIDNEADLDEERKYKFHEHVFLERHLTAFPESGPVRKFMELVCTGLGQNPWLTVPEKLEHIAWFEDYFKEKNDVLTTALGEQGKMVDISEK